MGFMDKAKKLAEQAQQKLDEAQQNFNQNASPQADPSEQAPQDSVRYDEHGRPIPDGPPAGATAPPSAEPPAADPDAPATDAADAPAAEAADAPTPDPAAPAPSGGDQANASPDPFKPLQQ
jgi:hypothetical protein